MKNNIFLWRVLLVFVIAQCAAYKSFSQKELYSFKQLSQEQGLPGVNIRDIFQDSRGIMWFSIEAIGLCKYYGDKFVLYDKDPKDTSSISNNFVNQVVEGKDGFLWIATEEGLNRYDRETDHFSVYYSNPGNAKSLSDNVIKTVFVDNERQLWIGTDNGLNKYDQETDSFQRYFYASKDSTPNLSLSVNDIFQHRDGTFWLGTNKGLVKFDSQNNTHTFYNRSNSCNGPIHDLIRSVEIDDQGILWIGTHRGLDRFDIQHEKFIPWTYENHDPENFQNEGVNQVFNDGHGRLWLGTYTKGIVVINQSDKNCTYLAKSEVNDHGLKSNHIRCFFKDNRGLLWIGSKFQGIFTFAMDKEISNIWPESLGIFLSIKDKHILSFYEDPILKKTYWVGSKFDGLYKIDLNDSTIKNYHFDKNRPGNISSNRVESLTRGKDGLLFVNTDFGLDWFDEKSEKFTNISQLPINTVTSDKNGVLWIGGFNGVFTLDEHLKIKRYTDSKHPFFKNENLDILQIKVDKTNTLWFSTRYNGLYHYDSKGDALRHYYHIDDGEGNSISGNMVRPVYFASDSSVWIGTKANGLNQLDRKTKTFKNYTTRDGLPVNFILAIQEDQDNNIWLATFKGLSKFDPVKKEFTNFDKDYGLQGNIYELGVAGIFKNGSLIFGGHNGFNIFHPDSLKRKSIVSPVLITSVKVFDREIKRDLVSDQSIELNHRDNQISFEFILADYADPYRHQFSYMLEGIDSKWRSSGNRNYVSYSNLPPGNYVFQVKGANEFGNWSENNLKLNITITPPFYETSLFIILLSIVVVGLVYGAYQVRVSTLRRSNIELESKVRKRTEELHKALVNIQEKKEEIESQNEELTAQFQEIISQKEHIQEINDELKLTHKELKVINEELDDRVRVRTTELVKTNQELDRFVYSASHDLSAPLKSILGLVNIAKYENRNKELSTHLEYMEKSVRKLENVIKSLTQFSRNKGNEIVHKEIAFEMLVNEIIDEFKIAFGSDQAEIIYEFSSKECVITDYYRLKIILSNLISNSLKYKSEDRKLVIRIGCYCQNGYYIISIRDNGMGIKQEQLSNIFNMFFRANSTVDGSGLGLYIVKETIEKLEGKISVNSVYGEYSEFQISLPAGSET